MDQRIINHYIGPGILDVYDGSDVYVLNVMKPHDRNGRLVKRFIGYSSKLWKGKRFETTMHVLFCLLWGYISRVFLMNCWSIYH